MGLNWGEGVYCYELSPDGTPKANEHQPDAAGNSDTAGGQLMCLCLNALQGVSLNDSQKEVYGKGASHDRSRPLQVVP